MIPLRITLKGFMSYRDEVTFSFDGKPLWMLAGPNGAGKSAVFDAMTYALYDHHRLGGQEHAELIHKRADNMSVEFEFACGDDVYAVKRTLARRGRVSREVFHIKGPHAPNLNRVGPQAMPETSSDKGFNRWVEETIGLSYETFTASVLLRQGNSDALLEADPAKRHEMLSQIVDLSAYKRLHDAAEKQQRQFDAEVRSLQSQLEGIARVEEHELAELAEKVAAQGKAAQGSQERLLHLAGLKVHAGHWTGLTGEQAGIRKVLDEACGLLARAEEIERDATRLDDLRRVVPLLRALLDARDHLHETEQQIQRHSQDIDALRKRARNAKAAQVEPERIVKDLRAQQEEFTRAQREAQRLLVAFGPQVAGIERMDRVQGEITGIDRALEAFVPDLDEQCATLAVEVDELTGLKGIVLPWLRQFVDARTRWREARAHSQAARQQLVGIRASLLADMTAQGVTSAAEWYERAQAEVTRAGTLLGQEKGRLERLQQVEGKPLCSYCGQELRPEYIADEQRRIDAAIQEAKIAQERAVDACKRATTLKKSEQDAEQCLRETLKAAERAERDGEGALTELPETYQIRIVPVVSDPGSRFAQDYPAEGDIVELRTQAGQLDAVKQRLKGIQGEVKKRDARRAQREPLAKELAELEGQYPPDVATEVRAGVERE